MTRTLAILAVCGAAWAQSAIPAPEGLPHPDGFEQLDCCVRGDRDLVNQALHEAVQCVSLLLILAHC